MKSVLFKSSKRKKLTDFLPKLVLIVGKQEPVFSWTVSTDSWLEGHESPALNQTNKLLGLAQQSNEDKQSTARGERVLIIQPAANGGFATNSEAAASWKYGVPRSEPRGKDECIQPPVLVLVTCPGAV